MRCQGDLLPISRHQLLLVLVLLVRVLIVEGLLPALLQLESQQQLPVDHHICIAPAAPGYSWGLSRLSKLQD